MTIQAYMENSDLVFFHPTDNFWQYFGGYQWKWRKLHDCGAGHGMLTKQMRAKGFEVAAYDIFARRNPAIHDLQVFDTARIDEQMDWSEVALLARPCHHPDFIRKTLMSALEMGEAFYIGGKKGSDSYVDDLRDFEYEVVARNVGKDHELLIRVLCRRDKHHILRKIKVHGGREEWWWYKPGLKRYQNSPHNPGGFPASDEKVLAEKHYANDLQHTWSKQEACKEDSIIGWIAPDGEWFGCNYRGHDAVAQHVLGCSVARLEKLGFCRCYGLQHDHMLWTHGPRALIDERKPTSRQKSVLKAKGYDLKH